GRPGLFAEGPLRVRRRPGGPEPGPRARPGRRVRGGPADRAGAHGPARRAAVRRPELRRAGRARCHALRGVRRTAFLNPEGWRERLKRAHPPLIFHCCHEMDRGRPAVAPASRTDRMVRIAEIAPGSIAEALELEIGSRIVRINGELVRDGIDFRFLEAESLLELEVHSPTAGSTTIYGIEKDAGEPLGVRPAPDPVRECANKCVFCFVDGNPEGVRRTLYLRDDDFRLSFTYGSYVTLTNLGPRGFQRLIDQRLSPLYVSVHATEPDVRMRLLGVPRGGEIVEQLR